MQAPVLKDFLQHKAYNWPQTVLTYGMSGKLPKASEDLLLMDGVSVPYETGRKTADEYDLKILADLPYKGAHHFSWEKGNSDFANLGKDNGRISFESVRGSLVKIKLSTNEVFFYDIETDAALISESETLRGGAIETIFEKKLVFDGGGEYTFLLKLKKQLDHIEIYEKMSGWNTHKAQLVVHWKNFEPGYRYTLDRGRERIDAYLNADGSLPFVINPFMPRISAWDQRYVVYDDPRKGLWSGLLLHDLKWYNDGSYSVWGSSTQLAFTLYEEKWCGRVADGTRAFIHVFCADKPVAAVGSHYLRYYSHVSLNSVKDWVLDWEDDQKDYPKYFRTREGLKWGGFYFERTGAPSPEDMMNILDRDATLFTTADLISPVGSRAYRTTWVQTFDLTAARLSDKQFKRVRAAMAFICYLYSSENYYPIENLLAGHPNFLADILGTIAAFTAILGKKHPMFDAWLAYYEIGTARNFKYHIRPEVPFWGAKGGRWTENVGGYMMAMLRCTVYDCWLFYSLYGEIPMINPYLEQFTAFLLNIQNAENAEGRRLYSPHGAHSCTGEFGGSYGHGFCLAMIQFAEMIKHYDPLYAEYILHNFRKQNDFDGVLEAGGLYGFSCKHLLENNGGTPPKMYSCKYTGFGYMLRSHENTDDEMNVFLQQLDEGPNYRWGRAADGGCGELFYYANGKKYTDHAPEAVGDDNLGDVQACTNFGVLIGHAYKTVGKNDLTEPLMDFGFVKYARVNAGAYSSPYYKYRSVLMVENQYIAVYDAVGDAKQYGRFVWAQNATDRFPNIYNVRPGAAHYMTSGAAPIDKGPDFSSKYPNGREMVFDGQGDFLTVVSHLRNSGNEKRLCGVEKQEYGVRVCFPQRTDCVFLDSARSAATHEDVEFLGYAGYVTEHLEEIRVAIFDGAYARKGKLSVSIPYSRSLRHGIGVRQGEGYIRGQAVFGGDGEVKIEADFEKDSRVWIDGKAATHRFDGRFCHFMMPQGVHTWNIGRYPNIETPVIFACAVEKDGFTLRWDDVIGAAEYEVEVASGSASQPNHGCRTKSTKSKTNFCKVTVTENGKYFVRVRGKRGSDYGAYSHPYPVYVSAHVPHYPDGLRIVPFKGGYKATWGEVLGVSGYRLYQKTMDDYALVYEGTQRHFEVEVGTYCVSAVNGNGEGNRSLTRSTFDSVVRWDHHPELGFVRDTRSFEHGYPGFDYVNTHTEKILDYPGLTPPKRT